MGRGRLWRGSDCRRQLMGSAAGNERAAACAQGCDRIAPRQRLLFFR
jgi:hypothetical protein